MTTPHTLFTPLRNLHHPRPRGPNRPGWWPLAGLLLALGGAGCVPHQSGSDQVPDINHAVTALKDNPSVGMPAAVDALIAAYLAGPGAPPGCAVGIMQNNTVAYLKGYGLADIENNRPFTHATPAVVGSVSKTWTALAVLRLMEMGLVNLDLPISNYLSVPAAWSQFTARQLLSHTAGIQRDPTFNPALNTEVKLSQFLFPWLNPPLLQLGIHPRLVLYSYLGTPVPGFAAGWTARYSNTGYMILGALINEVASDHPAVVGADFRSYESFVWRHVGFFDGKLGNADQMITPALNEYWRQTDIAGLARGYTWQAPDYVHTTFFNSSTLMLGPAGWEGPPGAWTVTIGDLVRLMMAIQNDDIIAPATRAQMMTVHGSDPNGNWGLGVNLITKAGLPVFMHDGAYPGFRARYTAWPTRDFGVAIMANESGADMRDITDAIAAVFLGGGSGIGGFSLAQSEVEPPAPLDDNDPGFGEGDFVRDDPLPELSEAGRSALWQDLLLLERRQLQAQQQRLELERRLADSGCLDVVEELLRDQGVDLLGLLAECHDGARTHGEFMSCVSHLLNDLVRQGIVTRQQRGRLQSCAAWLNPSVQR